MIKKILLMCSLLILTQNLMANEQKELEQKFLKKINDVILIVENKTFSKDERNSNIVTTLTTMFDFELMAKLSLGKTWKKLNKEDKLNFVKLYVKRMKRSYSSKIDAYSNEKVEVTKIKQPKANRIALITNLISNDNKLEIVYKYYKPKRQKANKDLWLIYDVEIIGVSILKTDKAQFKEYLQTKSISQLMNELNKK